MWCATLADTNVTPASDALRAPGWRTSAIALALVILWVLVLYRDTASAMVSIWMRSETFTHGFIVPPIVLWLVWRQRAVIAQLPPRPALWWLLPFGATAFIWLMADLAAVQSVTQLAMTVMVVLCVVTLLGGAVARLIIFPLAFLFFAVPIGEFVMPQLMDWTADVTVWALRLTGIPVYREGLRFVIPSGSWSVVQACSGVRYLIASLTVGTLFAYLNYRSTTRRVIFVGFSILVPIIANWMRAYIIVMLGHLSNNKIATGVDHIIYGWVFFGIVIFLLFMIGARWAEDSETPAAAPVPGTPATKPAHPGAVWFATGTLALIATLPLVAESQIKGAQVGVNPQLTAPATLSGTWAATTQAEPVWRPSFDNPSSELNASYTNGTAAVGMFVGYYRNQDYGHKLVSSENLMAKIEDSKWVPVTRGSRTTPLAGTPVALRTAEVRYIGGPVSPSGNGLLSAWQVYWINGTWTANDHLAKLYGAWYRLLGRGDESAVVVIYTPKLPGKSADATLDAFLSANYATVEALLQRTRSAR